MNCIYCFGLTPERSFTLVSECWIDSQIFQQWTNRLKNCTRLRLSLCKCSIFSFVYYLFISCIQKDNFPTVLLRFNSGIVGFCWLKPNKLLNDLDSEIKHSFKFLSVVAFVVACALNVNFYLKQHNCVIQEILNGKWSDLDGCFYDLDFEFSHRYSLQVFIHQNSVLRTTQPLQKMIILHFNESSRNDLQSWDVKKLRVIYYNIKSRLILLTSPQFYY